MVWYRVNFDRVMSIFRRSYTLTSLTYFIEWKLIGFLLEIIVKKFTKDFLESLKLPVMFFRPKLIWDPSNSWNFLTKFSSVFSFRWEFSISKVFTILRWRHSNYLSIKLTQFVWNSVSFRLYRCLDSGLVLKTWL